MLVRSDDFDQLAQGAVRPLTWDFYAAMEKDFNYDVTFFTLDESILDGPDILAPDESNVITEWDKYSYKDYTDRITSMEWTREEDVPYSVNLAMADVTLRNNDNFFTYGAAALSESYFDNFDNGLNNLWNVWGGSMVREVAGELHITVGPNEQYRGMNSIYGYDMTDSFYSVELVDAGNQASSNFECIPLEIVSVLDRNDKLKLAVEQDTIKSYKVINTVVTELDTEAYNPAVHKFFRIRESGGTTFWEYSTNSTSWTTLTSDDNPFDMTNMEVNILAGYFSNDTIESTAIFDNFNTNVTGQQLGSQRISPISSYNLPRRPIRLLAGFNGENLPQFVGLTDKSPAVDRLSLTASLHAEDFLSFIFDKPLDQSVIYENKFTNEVLAELFELVGLLPGQYILDQGFNKIAFVHFEKGTKLGQAIRQLMQAELGSLYMDEVGIIRFKNRIRQSTTPVYNFDQSSIIEYKTGDDDSIINVVEIKASVRTVQPLQVVYNLAEPVLIPHGATLDIFFNFEDPVTSIDTIDSYQAFTNQDGTGSDVTSDVVVNSATLFATAVKVSFENTDGGDAWITKLNILGTPARIVKEIYLREQDDASVEKFEEQVLTIDNDFIQTDDDAETIALSLLNYYKDYSPTIDMLVKGNYALQLGDNIQVDVDNISQDYAITKIVNILDSNGFRQRITGKVYNIPAFFILDESILNGPDVLAP